jgi:hypothetical protein
MLSLEPFRGLDLMTGFTHHLTNISLQLSKNNLIPAILPPASKDRFRINGSHRRLADDSFQDTPAELGHLSHSRRSIPHNNHPT